MTSALVAPSPLLLCCFPCGISNIAGRLLLCLQCSFAFQTFGLLTRCLFGISTSALRRDLGSQCGLTGDLPFMFLSSGLALSRAFGAGRRDSFTLAPLLRRGRILGCIACLNFVSIALLASEAHFNRF